MGVEDSVQDRIGGTHYSHMASLDVVGDICTADLRPSCSDRSYNLLRDRVRWVFRSWKAEIWD